MWRANPRPCHPHRWRQESRAAPGVYQMGSPYVPLGLALPRIYSQTDLKGRASRPTPPAGTLCAAGDRCTLSLGREVNIPYTPLTAQNLKKLADLKPKTLAAMHGSSFTGDCARALDDLNVMLREAFGGQKMRRLEVIGTYPASRLSQIPTFRQSRLSWHFSGSIRFSYRCGITSE